MEGIRGKYQRIWNFFEGGENVLKLIVALFAQFCKYTKIHWVIYLKWMDGIVCELYHDKAVTHKNNI